MFWQPRGLNQTGQYWRRQAATGYSQLIRRIAPANLVGYWRLGEPTGSTFDDIGSGNKDATIVAGITLAQTGLITGDSATSALFNGTSGTATLGAGGETFYDWERTQAWTIAAIVKPNMTRTTDGETCAIFSKMDSNSPFRGFEVELVYHSSVAKVLPKLFLINNFSSPLRIEVIAATATGDDVSNGVAHLVVFSYSGSGTAAGCRIWIDGKEQALTTNSDTLGANTILNDINPQIGSRNNAAQWFKGNIQELAIWNDDIAESASLVSSDGALTAGKPGQLWGKVNGLSLPTFWTGIPNVVLLTDLSGDIDDVGDVSIAWQEHHSNNINLIGVITDSANDFSADTAYAISDFLEPTISPSFIGAHQGANPTTNGAATSLYAADISGTFGQDVGRASYADGVQKLRALLAAQTNDSVVLVATGFFTVLDGLLTSAANAGGDGLASGSSLITDKVHSLVMVAGKYPTDGGVPEYNMVNGPSANANNFAANWPKQVFCVGIELGDAVLSGPPTTVTSSTNPVQQAWFDWDAVNNATRQSWGLLGVFFVARKLVSGVEPASGKGSLAVNSGTGANTWSASAGNFVFCRKTATNAVLATEFNNMYDAIV